jgi:hypothetical protein
VVDLRESIIVWLPLTAMVRVVKGKFVVDSMG